MSRQAMFSTMVGYIYHILRVVTESDLSKCDPGALDEISKNAMLGKKIYFQGKPS